MTGMGRLGRDPEIKDVNGKKVAKLTIAISRAGSKNEEGQIGAAWLDVEAWEGLAEFAEKYLKVGSRVLVSGDLRQSDWTAEDGTKRNKLYMRANKFDFVDSRADNGEEAATPSESKGKQLAAAGKAKASNDEYDPFA